MEDMLVLDRQNSAKTLTGRDSKTKIRGLLAT